MVTVKVDPGICGLKTTVSVTSEDMQTAAVSIESECPSVKQMEEELREVDAYAECFSGFGDSRVYAAAASHCRHVACPVPMAVIKGIEVACGLALPRDVGVGIEKS